MGDMDANTCLLDIIDDPNALNEFFSQGPEATQGAAPDSTDDLDDLQATLWDDDPNFVSSTTSEITIEGLASSASFSQHTLLSQGAQSVATFAPTTPSPSVQLQQVVQGSVQSGTTGVVQVASPYHSATPSPLAQAHGSPQVLSQAPSPMAQGTSASPMLQLPATTSTGQQVFLQPAVSAAQIQQVRQMQPQATLQTVQMSAASSPAPPNVVNIGQMVRPVTPSSAQVQIRPQQVVQAGTAQGGQVSLQGTIIQTSTGSRILIQQPVVPGQAINLANLQGLQIQGQVIQTAQNNQALTQGQVQQTQLVQQAAVHQQGQVLQTNHNAAQVVQQGQLLQHSQQSAQVLQSRNTQVLQPAQQGQVVQQQNIQQTPILQQNVVNPTTVQPQQQGQHTIANAGGIQLAGNQLPSGVSVVNINGQQILIQRAMAPGGQNIILRAVPNVIQIQAPAPNTVNQVGGQVASQPQLLITQPGQIHQSQVQLPTGQLASVGQSHVLGNLNVLNDSQNVNINVNILPAQGQGSASQALQQLQQSKVQLAGGQVVQTVQNQGSNQTTPIKILPKGKTAGNLQNVNIQPIQQHLVKPVTSTISSAATSTFQNASGQQVLNVPLSGQDILSAAAALNDIPLQVQTPTSQSIKPVINTATSIPNNSSSTIVASQVQTVKVEQKAMIQTVKVEQKPLIQDIKTEPNQSITETSQKMQSPLTVIKTENAQSQHAQISLSQQPGTVQSSLGSLGPIGSASQGLQALAANSGGTTQTVTIHHQPLQPKSVSTTNSSLQQISIPAISQGSVVTTMATINPSGSGVQEAGQNSNGGYVVLNQMGRHPAPNVNIANMPHLQTLPPKAAMLVQNSGSGASNTSGVVVSSMTTVTTAATTMSSAVTLSTAPTIIPTQVTPQVVASKVIQQGAVQAGVQNISVGNTNLLQRIHQQIKILLSIPNRTEQQQKMLQQLAQIEKKITSQAAGNTILNVSQEQQLPIVPSESQNKAVVVQQQVKHVSAQQPSAPISSITNTSAVGTGVTPQLVVATVQPTLPGTSKLIFTSTPSVVSGSTSLQGLLSTASTTSIQKPNVVTLQPGTNTTHLKIVPGMSPASGTGMIQLKPILSGQNVKSTPTTGGVAGASTVTVSNMGATTGGKLLITQPTQNQIQLPPGVKEKLEQQLAKLAPEQQELFKKHQPQVLLRLHQQLMKQQQGTIPGGITKIPITVGAGISGGASVLHTSASLQPLVVTSGSTPQFVIKRQVLPPQPLTRSQLIAQQLARDQRSATQPDCKNPFKHYRDACQRLLRFHVFQGDEPHYAEMTKEEDNFDDRSYELLQKKEKMFNKFELLTYKEAMRERVTSESVMLEKLFLQEESKILREDKHLALTDPESFVPRPSKRTKPSPETEDEDGLIKPEDSSEDNVKAPAAKMPRYGPTPSVFSPNSDVQNTSGQSVSPAQVKEETEVQEVPDDEPTNIVPKETGAYSLHSSGGLKLVFKSSPAHAGSSEYKPDSPLDTSDSKSGEVSMNQSGDSVAQLGQETDEIRNVLNTDAVPFQDYVDADHMGGDLTQGYEGSGTIKQRDEAAFSSTGDVSEDDAAVAGLLSDSGPTVDDSHLFGSQFVTGNSDFTKQSDIFTDSHSANPEQDNESAVSGIIDDADVPQMYDDSDDIQEYDTPQQESEHDYNSSEDEIQLAAPENAAQLNPMPDTNLPSNPTGGGLNNEMESAINSILSLHDPNESDEFPDMDEFMNSGSAGGDNAPGMFPAVATNTSTESTSDGQDDIEAAVQSILM